ncbi:hypothetical protein PVAND_005595 [Polypedilum vanderplanki]|uniref:Uncharacterized protein n=1 Tax=Polypedilum vanderplanki TaxID=319348 RepID=A0A9J6C129_POLVA|nr:hypothetical protein PVAND_005595 [Polypedilum vanderplanki]
MEEKSSSLNLKKCASLNNLIQNNQTASMNLVAASQSNPAQRDHLSLSLLTPRTRRFSCSSNGASNVVNNSNNGLISPGPPRLAPRVSQLRLEECADTQNVREANHEREVHTALSMSQSYEDLTLVMSENWTFKNNDEFSNPLHVSLPNSNACSSPSPTSRHSVMRLCASGMSPSPTRRTFATRRSMSPIAMRPSPLGSVKRKFDQLIDDGNSCSSSASSQPYKKFFTESYSRGTSPLPICPSPDSSTNSETFSGRVTPKILTKFSSMTSSPLSMHSFDNDSPSNLPSSSSSSLSSSTSAQVSAKEQERMETASTISGDSGIDTASDVQSDSVIKDSKEREEMVIEEEVTPSNIPMTL